MSGRTVWESISVWSANEDFGEEQRVIGSNAPSFLRYYADAGLDLFAVLCTLGNTWPLDLLGFVVGFNGPWRAWV